MIFNIDENNRIISGTLSWDIQERKIDKKGKEHWISVAYYTRLESAVEAMHERLMRKSDAESIADAINEIKLITTKIRHAFSVDPEIHSQVARHISG